MVSIVVPAYNVEKLIGRCILSITRQTYSDIELIVVDDGSTDNTLNISRQYSEKDSRIRILHKNNEGPEKAREYGLAHAKGELITFVDADDYLVENAINMAVNKMDTTKADIVCFGYVCNRKAGFSIKEEVLFNSQQALTNMLICNGLDGNLWCKLYRTFLLKQDNVKFENKRNCDFLTVAQIIENAGQILVVPDIGYCYSFIVGSQSRNIRCHINEEIYEIEAKKFLDSITNDLTGLKAAAEYNWLKALLYVNIKFEKDTSFHRNHKRMKAEKSKLRNSRKNFFKNPHLHFKDQIEYWMCYLNVFRPVYICYKMLHGIK